MMDSKKTKLIENKFSILKPDSLLCNFVTKIRKLFLFCSFSCFFCCRCWKICSIFAIEMQQFYSSQLLERAVSEFSRLPGVGRKTALRFVLYLLRQRMEDVESFVSAVSSLRRDIKHCRICHNICDTDVCAVCSDNSRDTSKVCVVENIQDVMAIENTQQYHGLYHVLGGVISPVDGVSPGDLEIESLIDRVKVGGIDEIIFALSGTMEGDTTVFYISRRLSGLNVRITVIARGISVGGELEYTDELTLGRSILNRIPLGE